MGKIRRAVRVFRSTGLTAFALGLSATAVSGASNASGAVVARSTTPSPAYGTVWVGSGSGLSEYAPGASGGAPPEHHIENTDGSLAATSGAALDARGYVWVANSANNELLAFSPDDDGSNVTPAMTISGTSTGLNQPLGLAVDKAGSIWVANAGSNSLLEFKTDRTGNASPSRAIVGYKTGLNHPDGVALTSNGRHVFAINSGGTSNPAVTEYSTRSRGNTAPIRAIAGSSNYTPAGVAVTELGREIVVTYNSMIVFYRLASHKRLQAVHTISGAQTQFNNASQLVPVVVDAKGRLYVAGTDGVLIFPRGKYGNLSPRVLGAGQATAIAVFAAKPHGPRLAYAHRTGKHVHVSWSHPRGSGGGVLGYEVRASHHRAGHWRIVGYTSQTAAKIKISSKYLFYDIRAFNEEGLSRPTKAIRA